MKSPIFRPAAAADLDDAFRWYERQRVGLGEEFLGAVRRTLDSIVEKPELYPVVRRGTRRAFLKRFPYGLYYRLLSDQVIIVACYHGKRDPRGWRKRK